MFPTFDWKCVTKKGEYATADRRVNIADDNGRYFEARRGQEPTEPER